MEQHESYLKSMKNTAEYKSLLDYTGFSAKFVKINSYIRVPSPKSYGSVGKDDVKVKDFVNSLNAFIDGAPKSGSSIRVYRGTGDYEIPIQNGKFVMKGFAGTSLLPETAAEFSQTTSCCLYELELPAGTPFLYLKSISKVPEEEEILIPSNTEFAFMGKKKITIGGKAYNVFVGKYLGFHGFDQMDFSSRSKIDDMTRLYIQNRYNINKNQTEGIVKLFSKDPVKIAKARADGEARWLKESEIIANSYGLAAEQVRSVVGGKRRRATKKKRSNRSASKS
jgi:hypothetical protein